jgi:hypothetical protein
MPPPDSPWLRHHRQRWLRHEAHLWIRPDAARFFPPGTDPADINPTLPRKSDAAQAAAFEAELAAEVEAGYRLLAVLREEVAELRAELKRRRLEEAKYSPSQPRVPAGNPRGGQWSNRNEGGAGSGGFGSGDSAELGSSSDGSGGEGEGVDASGMSSGPDSENFSDSIVKVAADDSERRYSVNLQEEEARGGHTLRDHVGKTDDYLIGLMNADYERSTSGNLEITRFRDAEGSFATPEQANDYVNQLLKLERDKVDQVATGAKDRDLLERRIGSVTGKEAFRPNGDSDPYIRDTYGVRAIIINDSRSPRGYTVRTAFPVNERPGRQ